MAKGRKATAPKNTAYVYGNTAEWLNVGFDTREAQRREQERIEAQKRAEREKREQRAREEAAHMRALQREHVRNMLFTAASIVVAIVMFYVCVQYLELNAQVKQKASKVANLESRLAHLTVLNDETEMEINASVDYDQLLYIAQHELGMVFPNRGQVIEYESKESEYVKQYQNIPVSR